MRAGVADLALLVGVAQACRVLGVPRATYYRHRPPDVQAKGVGEAPTKSDGDPPCPSGETAATLPPLPAPVAAVERREAASVPPPARHSRALSVDERAVVLAVLNSERFVDSAPRTVYATLLDEQQYLCSWRTMYRILAEADQVRERRNLLRRTGYTAPELLATAPNQLWSWDITKLRGPVAWTYYYLYVILDVFSRAVVGWLIAEREDADLAETLIAETCAKEGIRPQQLTIHADRGSAMTSKAVAQLLADLGVAKTREEAACLE